MAEKSIEEKARKIASQRPENGKEFEQMQAAQNQLLEIQAAQKQNLMERRVMAGAQAEQNQILAQAAETGAQSVAARNMQLNQATSNTLQQYGLTQPRTSSQSKQQHQETITRQNVTIHNNTTNITNNTVPANIGGPVQGRPVQFKQPGDDGQGGMGKFRNWLNQTFARQEEVAKRRDREYQRRETSLTKSANKMMRKIEDFSKDITKKLDPRNVGRSIGGQLKTILGVLGIGILAKNFDKVLDWIFGAQKKVEDEYIPSIKNFFAWIRGDEGAHKPGIIEKITEGIQKTFGGMLFGNDERLKGKGLIKGMAEYLWNDPEKGGEPGVLNKLLERFSDEIRKRNEKAMTVIDKDGLGLWSTLTNPGLALQKFLTNLMNYLSVMIGGDKALAKLQAEHVVGNTAATHSTDKTGEGLFGEKIYKRPEADRQVTKASAISGKRDRTSEGGDTSVTSGAYRLDKTVKVKGKWVDVSEGTDFQLTSDLVTEHGKLSGSVGSTIGAARQIISDYTYGASRGNINNARVSNNFKELIRLARESESKSVVVPIAFLNNSRTGNMVHDGKLKEEIRAGHIVALKGTHLYEVDRPKSDKELAESQYGGKFKKYGKEIGIGSFKFDTIAIVKSLEPYITLEGYRLGPNGTLVENKSTAAVGDNKNDAFKLLNEIQGFPLYRRVILWPEALKEGDIIIRELDESEVDNLIRVDEEGLRAIYYKGYLSDKQRQRVKLEDVKLDSSKQAIELIDESLVDIAKENGKKKFKKDLSPDALVDPEKANPGSSSGTSTAANTGATGTSGNTQQGDVVVNGSGNAPAVPMTPASTGTQDAGGGSSGSSSSAAPAASSGGSDEGVVSASGQGPFINAVMPIVSDALRRAGISEDFAPMMTAQAGMETGWRIGVGALQKEGKNLSGVIAPAMRGKPGKAGDVVKGGGVGGRDAIYVPNSKPGANSWWTKFRSYGDWADYVIWLVKTKWDAFSGGVEDYPVRLQTPSTNPKYKGQTYAEEGMRYAKSILAIYNSVKDYLKTGKYVPTKVSDIEFEGNVVDVNNLGEAGEGESSTSSFFKDAKNIIKDALGGLSHRIDKGTSWALDKVGDAMDFEASTTGGVTGKDMTGTEKYMASKYMNSKYSGFDNEVYAVPSSITGGSKLNRSEWWADFFDQDGNLKIKESDVSPQILNQLHEIQGELKKGNDLDELHLKIAAEGLDAEMYHSATEDQNQRRLMSALLVGNSEDSRADPMTGDKV